MIDDGEDVPVPPADPTAMRLSLLTTLTVQLCWALRATGNTRAELARRLGWKRESVDRLVQPDHRSRPEQLEAAFHALGCAIDVQVREAA